MLSVCLYCISLAFVFSLCVLFICTLRYTCVCDMSVFNISVYAVVHAHTVLWTTCTYCVCVYVLYKPYVFAFSEYYLSVPIVRTVLPA